MLFLEETTAARQAIIPIAERASFHKTVGMAVVCGANAENAKSEQHDATLLRSTNRIS
jgi:hypothetical protein